MPDGKPDWKAEVRKRLAALNLRPEREAEIVDEVAADLTDRYEELRSQRASGAEAFQAVLAELDARDLGSELRRSEPAYREPLPDGGPARGRWFADLFQDLRYAGRMLRK